jgi:phage gpG-like protein
MLGVKMAITFDSAQVRYATDKARQRVLKRQGAYTYKVARSKIRRRKKPSAPGSPPNTQTGALKRAIKFAADDKTATVGPTKTAIGYIGQLHEFGGTRPYLPEKKRRRNNWKIQIGGHGPIETSPLRFAKIKTPKQLRRAINAGMAVAPKEMEVIMMEQQSIASGHMARYPARPFMGPALRDASPHLAAFWKDSIR